LTLLEFLIRILKVLGNSENSPFAEPRVKLRKAENRRERVISPEEEK
jgi:hypothetical protein